ncbi:hypothetical protein DQ04_11361000 [Trypanosoma grayi]|uniref:hypothetical protein n=1 Tax=Trypanosoma grayi TaxID=71804 RepID=UPI0004F43047|nr:hypothetical protein DQ04_11361000 [Trypanosoma grayi]KEG06988.1 hypothetical protein DQ04_11361000 [Trypanosoma grayi]
MKRNTVFLVSAVVMMIMATLPYASAQSSSSKHIVTISGTAWSTVVQGSPTVLQNALLRDIEPKLNRPYSFNTTITVPSLAAGGALEALISVEQTLRTDIASTNLQHIWSAEEVTSLMTQSAYNATRALYPGSDTAVLVSIRIPDAGKQLSECTNVCKGMIAMGAVVGFLMIVTFVTVVTCVCCFRRSPKLEVGSNEPLEQSI